MEAERPARLVQVQPVRVGVVRDEQIDAAVVVGVHELRAEAVVVRRGVEPDALPDFAEAAVALVQEELVTHAEVVRRVAV